MHVCQSLQLCPNLCEPIDCSLPGSSVHGIFQARILGWVAIAFSNNYTIHHQLNRRELEQTPGDGGGQGGLACCSPWGCKEWDVTQ